MGIVVIPLADRFSIVKISEQVSKTVDILMIALNVVAMGFRKL